MPLVLLADAQQSAVQLFVQHCLNGVTNGSLIALIALGYTMVYGIIGLVNFAHGDLFMLGAMLALTILMSLGLDAANVSIGGTLIGFLLMLAIAPLFCAALNITVDYVVYRPLRNAPKLAPLVSAIGLSFIFMNLGQVWSATLDGIFKGGFSSGASERHFPDLIGSLVKKLEWQQNLLEGFGLQFTWKDVTVIALTVPIMLALTLFIRFTKLGKAMRATEQDPLAARLMGINVDRVISTTFGIGGALAGAASVIYGLYINTVGFQIGFTNGLYAFTAAVLGGIGNIPGAVLGALIIGLVRALGTAYVGEKWTSALVFVILILILVFKPQGLLGTKAKEKV
jgi:branched-chain amino acid transport system permease protein